MFECANCHIESATLISHQDVTGRESFCPECFLVMCYTLLDIKKGECPICDGVYYHFNECMFAKMIENRRKAEVMV